MQYQLDTSIKVFNNNKIAIFRQITNLQKIIKWSFTHQALNTNKAWKKYNCHELNILLADHFSTSPKASARDVGC